MKWVFDRLSERSTWLGLVGLISAFGVTLAPELQEAIVVAGLAVAGVVAVVMKDKLPKE